MSATLPRPAKAGGYAWYVLTVLMLIYMISFMDRYVLVGMLEFVRADLNGSDTLMGFLIGPAFGLLYICAGIPIAWLADRRSRVAILALGCTLWSLFTVLSGLARTPAELAVARLMVGLGEACALAPSYSLLSDYFAPGQRARTVSIYNLGIPLGQVVGLALGGVLAQHYGWRNTFIAVGLPGFLLALTLYLSVREAPRGGLDGRADDRPMMPPPFLQAMKHLVRLPAFPALCAAAALSGFGGMGFGYWAPTMFVRSFQLTPAEVGPMFGLIFGVTSVVGALAAGWLADRLSARNRAWPLKLAAFSVCGTTVLLWAVCFSPSVSLAYGLLALCGLLGGGWLAPVQATVQDMLPAELRATGTAVLNFCIILFGVTTSPQIVGLLSDWLAPTHGPHALRQALAIALGSGILGTLLMLLAARRYRPAATER